MGVSGCGKSTVGALLAERLGGSYIDGDDLHPAENVAKMSRGEPLNDADRAPWLDTVGTTLRDNEGVCVIGCSALKRSYRDRIRAAAGEPTAFVFLAGSASLIRARLAGRTGHYMPISLLDSQFADLEPPMPDEISVAVDIDRDVDVIVNEAAEFLKELRG